MKQLNVQEIRSLVLEAGELVGAQLQEIRSSVDQLALGFWHKQSRIWLLIGMKPSIPYIVVLFDKILKIKKKEKPVALFLKAHAINKRLKKIYLLGDEKTTEENKRGDRQVFIDLWNVQIKVILVPHRHNIFVIKGDKSISWNQPKVLSTNKIYYKSEKCRSPDQIREEIFKTSVVKKKKEKISPKEKLIDVKRKLQERYSSSKNEWKKISLWLKENWSLDVPEVWKEYIDRNLSIEENFKICVDKAKRETEKKKKLLTRIKEIERDLTLAPQNTPLKKGLYFEHKDLRIFIGKNAKENLKLLRQAKSWHYWLHLRDFPGAHGIIACGRNRLLTADEIKLFSQPLFRATFRSRKNRIYGEHFDVIVAQVKYVKPIKNDKHGRVVYTHDKNYRLVFLNNAENEDFFKKLT